MSLEYHFAARWLEAILEGGQLPGELEAALRLGESYRFDRLSLFMAGRGRAGLWGLYVGERLVLSVARCSGGQRVRVVGAPEGVPLVYLVGETGALWCIAPV